MAQLRDVNTAAYTPHYKNQCFYAWYASGRQAISRSNEYLPKDKYDRIPSANLVRTWRDEEFWDARADELDAKAELIAEDDLINARVMMLKEQAARGRLLQVQGMEYLEENGFDSSSSAVSAVFRGADLERTSRGISEHLVKMLKMPNDQLALEVQKMLQEAAESGEVIDVADIPESYEEVEESDEDGDD